jgi:hypothetical protein
MFDRTTKMLLATIALALWGLLLRPVFTPVPIHADTAPAAPNPNPVFTVTDKGLYLYHSDGNIYLFNPSNLALMSRAFYVPAPVFDPSPAPVANGAKYPATFVVTPTP